MSQDEVKKGLICPIGKYKGQPIEAMAEDKEYCDWLTAQPWFREKFANHYQVIINNFCEPSETPDHNALQARFLDEDFRLKFASVAIPRLWWYAQANGEMADQLAIRCVNPLKEFKANHCDKENENREKRFTYDKTRHDLHPDSPYYTEPKPVRFVKTKLIASCYSDFQCRRLAATTTPKFEEDGIDCQFLVSAGIKVRIGANEEIPYVKTKLLTSNISGDVRIEIKPEVGDDYPAILRQMRRNKSVFLFTRSYVGSGVTEAVFLQFMESQKVRVIFESEVDSEVQIVVDEFDSAVFLDLVKDKIKKISDQQHP